MICSAFPETYDAFDKEGRQIGHLRVDTWEFTVMCPDFEGDLVYSAGCGGGMFYSDIERESYLSKAKRAIARYYRDKEAEQPH